MEVVAKGERKPEWRVKERDNEYKLQSYKQLSNRGCGLFH